MKKQFLFLAMITLAIFLAGTTKVEAQKVYQTVPGDSDSDGLQCIRPKPLSSCVITAPELHPMQGVNYTYSVAGTPANATIRWFVVNNNDLKTASPVDSLIDFGGILPVTSTHIDATDAAGAYENTLANPSEYILNVATPANYNSATSTNTSITMSWKFFNGLPPNEILLVAYIESNPVCTNNIAVWRIIPTPSFTLDVATLSEVTGDSIAPAQGTGANIASECVSPIESAIYNSTLGTVNPDVTPGDMLTVDYGENWAYFVVNAANYIDSWMPIFQFTYTGGDAIPTFEASWAYIGDANSAVAANWHPISGTLGTTASNFTSAAVIAGASAASPGSAGAGIVPNALGECIVVRVRMDWGTTIEHDEANSTLRFAVTGTYYDGDNSSGGTFYDGATYRDLADDDCTADDWDHDWVDYNITPRPAIENGTPTQETKTGNTVN